MSGQWARERGEWGVGESGVGEWGERERECRQVEWGEGRKGRSGGVRGEGARENVHTAPHAVGARTDASARGASRGGARGAACAERRTRSEEWEERGSVGRPTRGLSRVGDKSSEPRLNLSGSWQQGHSAAYNTPFLIQVVCK